MLLYLISPCLAWCCIRVFAWPYAAFPASLPRYPGLASLPVPASLRAPFRLFTRRPGAPSVVLALAARRSPAFLSMRLGSPAMSATHCSDLAAAFPPLVAGSLISLAPSSSPRRFPTLGFSLGLPPPLSSSAAGWDALTCALARPPSLPFLPFFFFFSYPPFLCISALFCLLLLWPC